jgi:mRNA interferase RelE/StbE
VSYAVSIRRSAQKELESIPSPFFEKIEESMLALGNSPRPTGCKMLKGAEKSWRIRIGNYRLVYEIDDTARAITVIKIAHRSDVYR